MPPALRSPSRIADREGNRARRRESIRKGLDQLLSLNEEGVNELYTLAREDDYVAKCPTTQAAYDLWVDRFTVFLEDLLATDSDFVPDADTVLAFIIGVARIIRGRCGPQNLVSVITVRTGVEIVKKYCFLKYQSAFRWGKGDNTRLNSVIEKLIQGNVVTREASHQHIWITSHIIKRMNEEILAEALYGGTPSWEVTVLNTLALAIQSALCARAGDIVRSEGYTGTEALCWKDVTVFLPKPTGDPLPDGFSTPPLRAQFLLRYRKDEKVDPKKNFTVPIEELTDPSENAICPIKLLLIHALRTGAVAQKSWEDLLHSCNTFDRKVQWTRPNLPVLCRVGRGRTFLDLNQPATRKDIQKALDLGSKLVGLLQAPTTYALRYGAALEVEHVDHKSHGGGTGMHFVQQSLGHSEATRISGVTKNYIGNSAPHEMWSARRNAPEPENAQIGLNIAPGGARPDLPRATTDDITRICEETPGLNPTSTADRNRARHIRKKRHRDGWVQRQTLLMQTQIPIDNATAMDVDGGTGESDEGVEAEVAEIERDIFTNPTAASSRDLLNRFSAPVLDGDARVRVGALRGDFVQFFATYNVRKIHPDRVEGRWEKGIYNGSADPPVVDKRIYKIIPCTYADAGCKSTFPSKTMLNRHLGRGCKFSDRVRYRYQCEHEGCNALFETLDQLSAHDKRNHVVAAIKCNTKGCTSTELFPTDAALRKHRYEVHRAKAEYDGCPVAGCPDRRHFPSTSAIKRHFKSMHLDLPSEAKQRYIPVKDPFLNEHPEVRFFKKQRCSVPGCEHDVYFKNFCHYQKHASKKHNLETREAVVVFVLENPPPGPSGPVSSEE